MYEGKYFFISNVRTSEGVASQMLAYDSAVEAEIKFHDEVSYALKSNTISQAHFAVINEYGAVINRLEKTISTLTTDMTI